jgi:outer membrane receptor protein involved in Fe transport
MTNLGSATSKGFDVASTVKVTDGLTLNAGVSYVDAAYDETIRSGTRTLIKEGQRVADSPWSASVSALYEFQAIGRDAYARVDYQYRSPGKTPPVEITSLATPTPKLSFASLRAGVKVNEADVSLYVDNVFNAHPETISHESASSPLYLGLTSRPRTVGMTVSSRF